MSHCLFYSAKISENDDKLITLEIQIPDLTLSFARGLKREIFLNCLTINNELLFED